ncbi:hypothetical protein WMF20_23530 [Sorangium sp. So ce834]|uniref:hypothetical protein n=1 Tax=Sorangium sp. So ce834 TaxID=3133321 RepID=UPI003F628480
MSGDARRTALLGETLRQEGNYSGAIACFTEAINAKHNYWWAYAHRASARAALGDFKGATEDFYNKGVEDHYKTNNWAWFLAQKGELYRLWAMAATSSSDAQAAEDNAHLRSELKHRANSNVQLEPELKRRSIWWNVLCELALALFTEALGSGGPRNPWVLAHRGATYTTHYWIRTDIVRTLPKIERDELDERLSLRLEGEDIKNKEYHRADKDFSEALLLNPNYGWVYLFRAILRATRAHDEMPGPDERSKGPDGYRSESMCDIGMAQMSGLNRELTMVRAMMEMSIYTGGELRVASEKTGTNEKTSELRERARQILNEGVRFAWQTLQIESDETFARYFVANGLRQIELLDSAGARVRKPGDPAIHDPTVKAAVQRARVAVNGMDARLLAMSGGLDCLAGDLTEARKKLAKILELNDLQAITIVSRDPAWEPLRAELRAKPQIGRP